MEMPLMFTFYFVRSQSQSLKCENKINFIIHEENKLIKKYETIFFFIKFFS